MSNLDETYRDVVEAFSSLDAVRRQQPGNAALLHEHSSRLRKALNELKGTASKAEEPSGGNSAKPPETESKGPLASKASSVQTPAPSGPVTPSQEPSQSNKVELRKEATEQFHGRPLPGADKPNLKGVSPEWVLQRCKLADSELDTLDRLLDANPPDQSALQASLERLGKLLDSLKTPPAD